MKRGDQKSVSEKVNASDRATIAAKTTRRRALEAEPARASAPKTQRETRSCRWRRLRRNARRRTPRAARAVTRARTVCAYSDARARRRALTRNSARGRASPRSIDRGAASPSISRAFRLNPFRWRVRETRTTARRARFVGDSGDARKDEARERVSTPLFGAAR